MATITKQDYDTITALATAKAAAQDILTMAGRIGSGGDEYDVTQNPAYKKRYAEWTALLGGGAVPDSEPVVIFKNGRTVTFENKHAYYKQWYIDNFSMTPSEAEACAAEAVARAKPKAPAVLTDEQRRVNKQLGVSDEDFLKYNS